MWNSMILTRVKKVFDAHLLRLRPALEEMEFMDLFALN